MIKEFIVKEVPESNNGFSRVVLETDQFKALTNNSSPLEHKKSTDKRGNPVKVYTSETGTKLYLVSKIAMNEDGSPALNAAGYPVVRAFFMMKDEDAKRCDIGQPDEVAQYDIDFDFDAMAVVKATA